MLQLTIPESPDIEMWDDERNVFVVIPGCKSTTIQLEHSLMSVAKWESKWHKSFISTHEKTVDEFIDYIRCMTISKEIRPDIYQHLTAENMKAVNEYINEPMTATTVKRRPGKGATRKIITAEIIYSWMIDSEIPIDPCQKWHLNRLLMLIDVRNEQANPGKKMNPKSVMKNNSALNAARRSKLRSRG